MPIPSKVSQLPEQIKAVLDRKSIESAFSGYHQLEEWLETQGFEISHTTIHKYGQRFQVTLAELKTATEQAKAIVFVVGDDENSLSEAVTNLALQKVLIALQHIDPESQNENPKHAYDWTKVLGAIGKLSSQAIANKQYRSKMEKEIEKELHAIDSLKRSRGDYLALPEAQFALRPQVETYLVSWRDLCRKHPNCLVSIVP
jgi:Protein of unknown function (DUF3486)